MSYITFEQDDLEEHLTDNAVESIYFDAEESDDVNFHAMQRAEERAKWIEETIVRG